MKYFLVLLLMVLKIQSSSQNLVKNPDLEEYYYLPDLQYEYGERFLYKDFFICKHWHKIKSTTPDYYHINAKNERYGIPFNKIVNGYHPVMADSAYIGFIPFSLTGAIEPVSGEFVEKLKPGRKYTVSFYYRFAKLFSYFSLNKIDCFISKDINWRDNPRVNAWPFYKDIVTPELKANVVFQDTLNNDGDWHKMTGYYEAKGDEAYISFGIFYQNKRLVRLVNEYVGNNFVLGDKNEQELRFLERNRKHLSFIKRNSNCIPVQSNLEVNLKMKTKQTTTYILEDRVPYYFIDRIFVEEINE